jgi:hypothetical protein
MVVFSFSFIMEMDGITPHNSYFAARRRVFLCKRCQIVCIDDLNLQKGRIILSMYS